MVEVLFDKTQTECLEMLELIKQEVTACQTLEEIK